MKPVSFLAIISVLLLAALGLTACNNGEPQIGDPRIHFDQKTVDLGIIPPGDSIDFSFNFTNMGNAPLIIDDVKIKTMEGC